MNMGQRHKHADVIIAWVEGKDVQVWDKGDERWSDVRSRTPIFNEDWEYRIKPPAKKFRVALIKGGRLVYPSIVDSKCGEDMYEKDNAFVRWLTDWIEYEVED